MTEDRLRYILTFVDSHVRFAEAKNAALFAVDVAVGGGAFQLLQNASVNTGPTKLYLIVLLICMATSSVIALLSFLPQTHIPWHRVRDPVSAHDSMLFFGHIQKYDSALYLATLADQSGDPNAQFTVLDQAYASQIIVNAKIASRKFTYFRYAVWTSLGGLVTPVLAVVLWLALADRPEATGA
jgi:hypothetical protein